MTKITDWRAFWNGPHRIYVDDRHRAVHYAKIADDIIAALPTGGHAAMLDFGCGDALEAGRIARHCQRVILADAAPNVRARLLQRLQGNAGIEVLASEEVGELAEASLDLIVMNSVAQYLAPAELDGWLTVFGDKLRPGGQLLLADILPPEDSVLADAAALLAVAYRHGFLLPALTGLTATFLSDYRRLRDRLGLTRYSEADMLAKLARAGFNARRRAQNLGFNQRRMAFEATPAAKGAAPCAPRPDPARTRADPDWTAPSNRVKMLVQQEASAFAVSLCEREMR